MFIKCLSVSGGPRYWSTRSHQLVWKDEWAHQIIFIFH